MMVVIWSGITALGAGLLTASRSVGTMQCSRSFHTGGRVFHNEPENEKHSQRDDGGQRHEPTCTGQVTGATGPLGSSGLFKAIEEILAIRDDFKNKAPCRARS